MGAFPRRRAMRLPDGGFQRVITKPREETVHLAPVIAQRRVQHLAQCMLADAVHQE